MFFRTIVARLYAAFVFGVVVTAGLAAFCVYEITSIDEITQKIRKRAMSQSLLIGELTDGVAEFHLAEAKLLIAASALDTTKALEQIRRVETFMDSNLVKFAATVGSDQQRALFMLAEDSWIVLRKTHELTDFRPANPRAVERFNDDLDKAYRNAEEAADALLDDIKTRAAADGEAVSEATRNTIHVAANLTIVSLFATGLVLWFIRRHVSRPLSEITRALTRLSRGDLHVRVPATDSDDEIGEMARAFKVFLANAVELKTANIEKERAHALAEYLAQHDPLTGLPNRRLLSETLARVIDERAAQDEVQAIFLIDLDRFKPVNDLYGHATGDCVLREVATRLQHAMCEGEMAARLGGDEFAAVLRAASVDRMLARARSLVVSLNQPVVVDLNYLDVGATIGVALSPAHGKTPEELLRAADLAMYQAKRDRRGSFRMFEDSLEEALRSKAHLVADLRKAIDAGDVAPFYQPLMCLAKGELIGFEILARWTHAERGFVPPDVFIPAAEDAGLIGELTYQLLRRVCRETLNWPPHLSLALNISPTQLDDPALPQRILSILVQENFPPSRLEIEVTENALIRDIEKAKTILEAIRSVGIHVVLDDFGTGYSSLYHLRKLRFDKIKIDRSYVQSVFDDPESAKIVDAIIGLGKSLGLPTTAEGIEDQEHLARFVELGCEFGQGYHFGKAMTVAAAESFIDEWSIEPMRRKKIA